MLSSVSKLADKSFVIGFFIPALLAVLAVGYVFQEVPWIGSWHDTMTSAKSFTDLTYLVVSVWVLGLLLMLSNYEFYRLLEGYSGPFAWFKGLPARHRRKLLALRKRHEELIASGDRPAASKITWALNRDYPKDENAVLPTLFGNRIRAFEWYPNDLYGADGVTLWPRLATVVSAKYVAVINDARSQVDCMTNICILGALLSLCALLRLVLEEPWKRMPPDGIVLGVAVVAGAAISYFAYLGAAARIVDWGESLKSAFDCFLPALAKQLGYALPIIESQRKIFWDDITRLLLYHKALDDGKWPPA